MPTITGTIRKVDNVTPIAGVYVVATLVPSIDRNPPGFVPTSPSNVVGSATYTTKKDGQFTLVLTDNVTITPAGTCYRFDYRIPGARPVHFYKYVGAVDSDVDDLDDADPTNIPQGQGHGDVIGFWDHDNRVVGILGSTFTGTPDPGDVPEFDGTHWTFVPNATGGGSGSSTHLLVSDFGLGDGSTSDTIAIRNALAAQRGLFTQQGLDRAGRGATLEFPEGVWTLDPADPDLAYPGYGSMLQSLAPTGSNPKGGALHIVGQGSGATTLQLASGLSRTFTLTSSVRGGTGGGPGDDNTYTLDLGFTHNGYVGQPFVVNCISAGRAIGLHYCVYAIPNAHTIQYKAHRASDGTGHTQRTGSPAGYGGDLDWGIPPLTIDTYPGNAAVAVNVPNTVTLLEYCWEFLYGSQSFPFFVDGMSLLGPGTGDPTDSIGFRWDARVNVGTDFQMNGWWIGGVASGTPTRGADPTVAGDPQNTDHHWFKSKLINNNARAHLAWIDNAASSWFRADKIGFGGGRDEHIVEANFGGSAFTPLLFNDAGNFETTELVGTNIKGGSYPCFFEGIDGLDRKEGKIVDRLAAGWIKIESPGNVGFLWDESGLGELHQIPPNWLLEMEAGIDWNGADTGIPGGKGSVAQGSFADTTDKPWPVWDASLTTIDGCPTLTATVPQSMFGPMGGRDLGTIIGVGLAERFSGMQTSAGSDAGYNADGVTVPGSGSTTIASGSNGQTLPQGTLNVASTVGATLTSGYCIVTTNDGAKNVVHFTGSTGTTLTGCTGGTSTLHTGDAVAFVGVFRSATAGFVNTVTDGSPQQRVWDGDVNLRIDSDNLHSQSDTIAQVNSATEVVMNAAVTVSSTNQSWRIHNDGTVAQADLAWSYRVKTVSAPDVNGNVVITAQYPIYAGLDLPGPYSAMIGKGAFVRAGDLIATDGWPVLFGTQSLDRAVHAQNFLDLKSIHTGSIHLIADELPNTRRRLPAVRVWDSLTRVGNDLTTTNGSPVVTSDGQAVFHPADVGKFLDEISLNSNGGRATIISVESPTQATMDSNAGNLAGAGHAWIVHPVKGNTPFEFSVSHGKTQIFQLWQCDDLDTNPIARGDQLEFEIDLTSELCVRRSQASFANEWAGVAMTASPAGNIPTSPIVGTVGLTSARVETDFPTVWVARYPVVLTTDDQAQVNVAASLLGGAANIPKGTKLKDKGDGTVDIPSGVGLERIVGQSIGQGTPGAQVAATLRAGDKWDVGTIDGGLET